MICFFLTPHPLAAKSPLLPLQSLPQRGKAVQDRRVVFQCSNGRGTDKEWIDTVAGMGENLKAGRVELMDKFLGFRKPAEAMSSCSIVIHISGVNAYSRDFVDVVVPRVHCNAEKEDRESSTHVDAST